MLARSQYAANFESRDIHTPYNFSGKLDAQGPESAPTATAASPREAFDKEQ